MLLFTLFLSETTPAWAMLDEDANGISHPKTAKKRKGTSQSAAVTLSQLQERSKKARNETKKRVAQYDNTLTKVMLFGYSAHGKTALVECLAGPLFAKEKAGELRLKSYNPLPGFTIGKGNGKAGTAISGAWHDKAHDMVFWDNPGWGDPAPNGEDIINAAAIRQIFTPGTNAKILLAIDEAILYQAQPIDFQNLLNEITGIFPHIDELKKSLSVVITKASKKPLTRLNYLQKKGQLQKLTPPAKDLLKFLVDNSEKRIALFPAPKEEGDYKFDKESIYKVIEATEPTLNPTVTPYLNDVSRILVTNFAQELNDNAVNFLKNQGTQQVVDYCNNEVDNHQGSITALRANLGKIVQGLRLLQNVSVKAKDFADVFDKFFSTHNPLRKLVDSLTFLKSIKGDVRYDLPAWSQALKGLIDKLDLRIKAPQPIYDAVTKSVSLEANILGTKDLKAMLKKYPLLKSIKVHASDTLIIDKNITCHGASCSFIAHSMKVKGKKTMDLSGIPGASITTQAATGANGKPGNPGRSGGHFYAKAVSFTHLDQLTIDTSGGKGGDGQKGGTGKKGDDGKDEEYPSAQYVPTRVDSTNLPQRSKINPYRRAPFSLGGASPWRIGQIKINAGGFVDGIEVLVRAGKNEMVSLGKAGGPGGTMHEINLNSDEKLTGCYGTYGIYKEGQVLNQLYLVTNKRSSIGPFGSIKGDRTFSENYPDKEVTGISGDQGIADIFHVITVHRFTWGNVNPSQVRADGKEGKKGGDGGKGGIGGLPGTAVIKGATFTHIANNGTSGKNGNGGDGGKGGKHGRYHMLKDRGRADNGPKGGLSQVTPPAPTALPAINMQTAINLYKAYYLQEASDPLVSPFVKVFPNLKP